MITIATPSGAIHIPPAALEAGARALYRDYHPSQEVWSYAALTPEAQERWRVKARAAFVAMVEAWPDMAHRVMPYSALILPLTENPDDKA